MEGGFVEGFGDGTRAVQELAPISPTAAGITASERFIQDSGKDTRQLEQKRLLTAGVGASLSRA
ncbi:MAG TPA: hypothetical protein VH333_21545 [Pseudonocardiaceae bacterium]|nr:hypothetical protein [Pseudonocardiaceae bacterium]